MAERLLCAKCVKLADPPVEACGACHGPVERAEVHPGATDDLAGVHETLRRWRGKQARLQGAEPFLVLPNRTLALLAAAQPEDRAGLRRVSGIGPAKDRDYGLVLTRWFRDVHAGASGEPALVRGPVPEGVDDDLEALLVDLREAASPLHELARRRGLDDDALLARVETLVRAGAGDVVHLLCAPLDVRTLAAYLEEHRAADAAELAKAFPHASPLACRLVPLLAALRRAGPPP